MMIERASKGRGTRANRELLAFERETVFFQQVIVKHPRFTTIIITNGC